MKFILLLSLVLILSGSTLQEGQDIEHEEGVMILNSGNFEDVIKNNKAVFVKFYTDWCPHCQKLKPKWRKLSKFLGDNGHNVKIAMINAEKHPEMAEKYKVIF